MTVVPIDKYKGRTQKRPRNKQGLTPKQELFAQAVARGLTYKAAYLECYQVTTMKDEGVRVAASRLADLPHVDQRIKDLLAVRYEKSMLKDSQRLRQIIFDGLMDEAQNADNSASARLKAFELMGKIDVVGLFKERNEVEHTNNTSSEELAETLKGKLREAMQDIASTDKTAK